MDRDDNAYFKMDAVRGDRRLRPGRVHLLRGGLGLMAPGGGARTRRGRSPHKSRRWWPAVLS